MRNSYEVRAERFIYQLYPYIQNCECYYDFDKAIKFFNIRNRRKVIFAHGLTRVAFITSDYVVKMTFGRQDYINNFGDCEAEYHMYKRAERDGFDYLLAKPTLLEYNNIKF